MNIILFDSLPSFLKRGDERAEHILNVLHLRKGDHFRGGIINGCALDVAIDEIREEGIYLSAEEGEDLSGLTGLEVILAEVRPISMRRILRELASLGVSKLYLVISDFGEKSYRDASLYKGGEWRKIVLDGAMQAGMTGVMDVELHLALPDLLSSLHHRDRLIFDNVIGKKGLGEIPSLSDNVVIAIGPERGWSARERNSFLENGFSPILLGKRILRTETAAVAATSNTLMKMGLI